MSRVPNCNSFKSKEECNANDKCFWGKDSSKTERCGDASTDKKKANLIAIDLSFKAPIPLEGIESTYPELKNVWDKKTLIRLIKALGNYSELFKHQYFKNYLFYNKEEKSKDALTSFFVKVFKIPQGRIEEYKKIIKERINKIIERLEKEGTAKINQDELKEKVGELPNVPLTSPGGESSTVPTPPPGAKAPPPPPGAGTPPGAVEGGAPSSSGTLVYDPGSNLLPAGNLGQTGEYSLANNPPKQSPALPPRKQPFNIEEEMLKIIETGLEEQKFPGFWGRAELPK